MQTGSRHCCLVLLSGLLAGWLAVDEAVGQELRDLVDQVLDERIANVQIEGLALPDALAQLGEKTGLSFVMDPVAIEWMPYGERTKVSIDLRDLPVRHALRRMFDGLGLTMAIVGDKIHIGPGPALERLGRRMTIDEVRLLGNLAAKTWSELPADARAVQVRSADKALTTESLESAIAGTPAANALEQLEAATQQHGWCWVPQDGAILAYTRAEDIRRRLERPIDLDYQGVPLDEVLIDLGKRAGVTMNFEPGVLGRIQAGQRKLDLVHRNTTLRQTLQRICGTTGMTFEADGNGISVRLAAGVGPASRPAAGRILAMLSIPVGKDGMRIEIPFYEDTIPAEFRRLAERELPGVLEELRRREGR